MPNAAVLLTTGLVSTTTYPYTITVGSVGSIADTILDRESLEIDDTATSDANGTVSFRYLDVDNTRPLAFETLVTIYDDTLNLTVFTGLVRAFHYEQRAIGRWVVVDQAVHIGILLDEILVPYETRPAGEGTAARLAYFWGQYARYPLQPQLDYVADVSGSLPADVFQNLTLRSTVAQIGATSGSSVRYYVDAMGRPHLFSGSEASPGAAPFNINVALAPGGGNIAPTDLRVTTEGPIKNRLYIRGANADGSGWFQDDASVAQYGRREDYIDAPSSETPTKAQAIALLQLGRVAQPNIRGTFSTQSPNDGWKAGQTITLTSPQDGLSSYATSLVRVRTRFLTGEASPKRTYEMEFSDTGATLSGIPAIPQVAIVGNVIQGTIGDGTAVSLGNDQTYITNSGVVVNDGTYDRVVMGAIASNPIDYGLKVVSSDGSTVIIDGNSDMFKISATGTLTQAFPAIGTHAISNVALPALGAPAVSPMLAVSTSMGNASGNPRTPGWTGAVDAATGHVNNHLEAGVFLNATVVTVSLIAYSDLGQPGLDAYCRWYTLLEVAI